MPCARYWPVRTAKSSHPNKCGFSSTLVQTLHNETRVVRVARVTPRTRTMLGAINKVKAWGDEKMPELSAKMKELGDKIAPPGGPSKAVPEDPSLIPLRALQRIPPPNPEGTPEMRLLVVLQPPEELPAPPPPAGTYNLVQIIGNQVFVSGIGPLAPTSDAHIAKIGTTEDKANGVVGVDDGKKAARACALTMLSVLRNQLGSLNHVKRLVKANAFVNATPEFTQHPEVVNGFSETMVEMFGERGKAARSAVGVASLPRGWAVEVDAVFELQDELVVGRR